MSTLDEEQRREGILRSLFPDTENYTTVTNDVAHTTYVDEDGEIHEFRALSDGLEAMRQDAEQARTTGYADLIYRAAADPSFQDVVYAVTAEAADLVIQRQRTYGPSNIEQQGVLGIVNRIGMDKLARIRQRLNGLVVNGEVVLDEIELGDVNEPGIINDAFDVIGYAVCLILLLRGEWGYPLEGE